MKKGEEVEVRKERFSQQSERLSSLVIKSLGNPLKTKERS